MTLRIKEKRGNWQRDSSGSRTMPFSEAVILLVCTRIEGEPGLANSGYNISAPFSVSRSRCFWLVPGVATSHGLPIESDKSDWLKIQNNSRMRFWTMVLIITEREVGLGDPLTPVPAVTGRDEPWPFFHFSVTSSLLTKIGIINTELLQEEKIFQ